MNTNMPENLMDNVERKLRKHVKDKRKNLHRVAAVLIGLAVILPASAFAYAQYMGTDSILYKQEIDLARKNNDAINVNKIFKYKDVTFTIKNIVGDTTGMEIIYETSDPKYCVSDISLGDKDNKIFHMYSKEYLDSATSKEKSFYIEFNSDEVSNTKDNPVTINITSIYGSDKIIKVDWTLKTKIAIKEIKTIPINKEVALDIGTLRINSLNLGIIKSKFSYSFVAKESNIATIAPIFSVRLGDKYTTSISGENYGPDEGIAILDQSEYSGYHGNSEFDSVYYQKINQIAIKLVGIDVNYHFNNSKIYKINKNKLPTEYIYNGEKFTVTAIKNKNDVVKYNVEYGKDNRVYKSIQIQFCQDTSESSGYETNNKIGKLEYINQVSRDKLYAALVKKVPNLKKVEGREGYGFEDGVITSEITIHNKGNEVPLEFKIAGASKKLIYDEDEIVINN